MGSVDPDALLYGAVRRRRARGRVRVRIVGSYAAGGSRARPSRRRVGLAMSASSTPLSVCLLIVCGLECSAATAADSTLPGVSIVSRWRNITSTPVLEPVTLNRPGQQPVDFAVWEAADGTWQLLSCIRGTGVGGHTRLLYRWESPNFFADGEWEGKGVAMVAETRYGEELGGLQAPHVTRWGPNDAPQYHMFYGTWSSIAQATSVDGKIFRRSLDSNGRSPIFQQDSNRSNTRDPMLFRVSAQPGLDVMHLVYSSFPDVGHWGAQDGVWARTISLGGSAYSNASARLTDGNAWAETRGTMIGYQGDGKFMTGKYSSECPFVIQVDEWFYLFRTQRYTPDGGQTSVFASKDPANFGVGATASRYLVATLPICAPEIVTIGDKYYVVALKEGLDGMRVAELSFGSALP